MIWVIVTRKLPIMSVSDIGLVERKIFEYNGCFMSLYNNFDLSQDPDYVQRIMSRFGMTQIGFRSCLSDAKAMAEQDIRNDEQRRKKIEVQEKRIGSGKLNPRQISEAKAKIRFMEKRIGKRSCFGGYALKSDLDRLVNKPNKTDEDLSRIEEKKKEWRGKRTRPMMVVGEANYKGNRFFDVTHLTESYIVYKPNMKTHIRVNISINRRLREELELMAGLAERKEIPVTVSMSRDMIWLSYDLEKLYGIALDEKSRREEVKGIKNQHHPKDIEERLIKDCYRKWHKEHEDRKLKDRNRDRAVSVDMNPGYIGWSILEKDEDGEIIVLRCGTFDFHELCEKTGEASSSRKSKRITNKRKYEISICIKKLFGLADHYRCAYFFIEDLSFGKDSEKKSKESNRKNRNSWNRELMVNCMMRGCDEHSMELREVNACYTSFIGNIRYEYGDPTSAAVEIGRRGLWQYTTRFYPKMTRRDEDSLRRKFGDVVQGRSDVSWVEWYRTSKELYGSVKLNQILRDKVDDMCDSYLVGRLDSVKSKTFMKVFIKENEFLQ